MKVTGGEFTAETTEQSTSNTQDVSEVEGACMQPELHFNCVAFPKKVKHVSRIYNKNWQN